MTIGWMARAGGGFICTMLVLAIGAAPAVAQVEAGAPPLSGVIPATHLRGAVCEVAGNDHIPSPPAIPSPPGSTPPPTVSANPSGVDVVWLPGMNSKTCKVVRTRGNAHIASALARDIDAASVVPNASTYHCPFDDGTSARLYFTYAHGVAQRIDADLSGCSWITAPGDASVRSSTAQFRKDMTTLAPSAWHGYIAPNPDPSG